MTTAAITGIHIGIVLLLWMPLVVSPNTVQAFMVGKALYAHTLIEVIAALWLVLVLRDRSFLPPRSWVIPAFGAYVGTALLSAVAGVSFTHSFWSDYVRMAGVWDLLHWFLLVVVAASVLRTRHAWHSLFNWYLAVALVLSAIGIGQVYGLSLRPYILPSQGRIEATLANPSLLAALLVVAIPLAVGFLVRSFLHGAPEHEAHIPSATSKAGAGIRQGLFHFIHRPLWPRVFWALTAALALWALFLTGTRGALAGLVAGALVMTVAPLFPANRRALRPVALAGAGLLIATAALIAVDLTVGLPTGAASQGATIPSRLAQPTAGGGDTLSSRLQNARIGLEAFLERPFLGWGHANFQAAYESRFTADLYRYSTGTTDQAHNILVEQLTTKGILGAIAYIALWAAVVWAIVRRRRGSRDAVVAYAVLGALGAYFVQNLFLFDTPPTLLAWTLLVAWAAAQERPAGPQAAIAEAPRPSLASSPWATALALAVIGALLGTSLYLFTYRPYTAARTAFQALGEPGTVAERVALARRSFQAFPPLADWIRQRFFVLVSEQWPNLPDRDRLLAAEFVASQMKDILESAPRDPATLASALPILQAVATSREDLDRLDPPLRRLKQLAPERAYTYELLALQALRKGDYWRAIALADEFAAKAPEQAGRLEELKRAAQRQLDQERE